MDTNKCNSKYRIVGDFSPRPTYRGPADVNVPSTGPTNALKLAPGKQGEFLKRILVEGYKGSAT